MARVQNQATAAALRARVAELKQARSETIWRVSEATGPEGGNLAGHPDVVAHDQEIRDTLMQAIALENGDEPAPQEDQS